MLTGKLRFCDEISYSTLRLTVGARNKQRAIECKVQLPSKSAERRLFK